MIKNKALPLILNISLYALLSACGGGGGGASDSSGPFERSEPAPVSYTVTSEAGTGGEITPASQRVTADSRAAFDVTPATGYRISEVSGCSGELAGNTYTTAAITADCTVTAEFTPEQRYPVHGTVSGLDGELRLRLEVDDNVEDITLSASGQSRSFEFDTQVYPGEAYEVEVVSEPSQQSCEANNGFGEMPAGGAEPIDVRCVADVTTATLSGQITPAANIDVDSDVNDRRSSLQDNSAPSLAQPIHPRATLHGFASAEPTGGDPQLEWFADEADLDDFYRVTLEAGQSVQLQVVDHPSLLDLNSAYEGDLDLYLYRASGEPVAGSDSTKQFEQVSAPEDGEYLVRVAAYDGISKYVLRISAVAETETAATGMDFVPDELIIKWKPRADVASVRAAMAGVQLRASHQDAGRPVLLELERTSTPDLQAKSKGAAKARRADRELQQLNPRGYAKTETLRQIKSLRLHPDVEYAEPNFIRRAYLEPNDPGYRYQWHYGAISLPEAWERLAGNSTYEPITAVIDSGVFLDHPDLQTRLLDGYDFVRDATAARDGDGIDPNPDDPGDNEARGQSSWHGTHVAGTVAAAANNGRGGAGVTWTGRIMPVRVLGEGGATSYDVVQGLYYAAGLPNDSGTVPERRADVANLSLGGDSGSRAEREAYQAARDTGMVIIAAAGNEGRSQPSYPAGYSSVISVSATDYMDQPAPYSNFGTTIAVAAPGGYMAADQNRDGYPDGVLSTLVDDNTGSREATYSFYHGTSMAAPHMAGVVALMMSIYPELTPDEVDALLESGAITDDRGEPGWDERFGYGLINAVKAVIAAEELAGGEEPPEVPAQVEVSPDNLYLGYASAAEVTVTNEGGGDPQITAVESDSDWLSAAPLETDSAGLGTYAINVNRAELADGAYRGSITFTVDGGNVVTLRVFIQVGAVSTEATLGQLYVLLLNAENDAVVDMVLAENAADVATYEFNEVPIGSYRIMAGTDIDVDDFVCQSGESCGAYPTLERQQRVEVDGVDQTDLDFVANILGSFPETAGAVEGLEPLFYGGAAYLSLKQPDGVKVPAEAYSVDTTGQVAQPAQKPSAMPWATDRVDLPELNAKGQ